MSRWLSIIPLVVLAALAALFIGWSLNRDPSVSPDALVGQPIPETVLPMLTGDQPGPGHLDLKTAGVGKPMLVNEGRAGLDLGITGAPETFAVNAMGVVVAKSSGPLVDAAEIERLIVAMQAPPRPLPTAEPR